MARNPHLLHERDLLRAAQSESERAADSITAFAGSMSFVGIHAVWFGLWILLAGALLALDPFPYGLLTMIVSLEAIFLATFVMISQNREAKRSEIRADLDFRTNVHADVLDEHIAAALNRLGKQAGIGNVISIDAVHAEVEDRLAAALATEGAAGDEPT